MKNVSKLYLTSFTKLVLLGLLASCAAPPAVINLNKDKSDNLKPGTGKNPNTPGDDDDDQDDTDNGNGDGTGTKDPSNPKDPTDPKDPVDQTEKDPVVPGTDPGSMVLTGNIKVPADRGYQNIPWEEFQAEDGKLGGAAKVIGPSRKKWDITHIEAEAIGRKAVRLDNTGDSVTFKPTKKGNSIVLRYSIPDSPNGGGIDATIGVYVNGTRVPLKVTSRYSWSYQGGLIGDPKMDDPRVSSASPHTFFDESRMLLPEFAAGSEIKIQRDAQDNAAFYIIDLADFEMVAPPLTMPAGFVSIETLIPEVKANDGKDHADDIIKAVNAAKGYKGLWFPPGKFLANKFNTYSSNEGIDNPGVEVRGAGMWHTELNGRRMIWFCNGPVKCTYSDFSIFGESKARAEETEGVQKAFAGPQGMDSSIKRVWVEHVVSAIWVGNDPPYQMTPTKRLTIEDVRIRNTYADGINFDNGTSESTATNVHMRNTGDDGAVVWSVKWTDWVKEKSYQAGPDFIKPDGKNAPDQGVAENNTFKHITVQMPWRANCFASYGGQNNKWEKLVCEDVLTYPGILIDNEFSPYPFGPKVNSFTDIHLIRAGGPMFLEPAPWEHGALKFYQREGSVTDILVENVDIIDPTFAGIEFKGFGTKFVPPGEKFHPDMIRDAEQAKFKNITLKNITITNAGTYGIEVGDAGGQGEVSFENVKVIKPAKGGLLNKDNNAPASFFIKKAGNEGW
ncbi:MAG: hypothetical protein EOP07_05050 [Proteobacteria bacterium]|nr:MAG: hypothetical protein EOP07_05050 [Pseudomonadota bacterium]